MLITEDYQIHFENAIAKVQEFAIVPHYNPDPDALGSAFGLYCLLSKHYHKKVTIYFQGVIGRPENKAMIELLGIPLTELTDETPFPNAPIILMDTQPATGNNPLPENIQPFMIFDHHPIKNESRKAEFADIRFDFGSTSTIISDYLKTLNVKLTVGTATALYYGIQTDVVGEGRNGNKIDFVTMEFLSKYINRQKLYAIENPRLSFEYYTNIEKGLKNSVLYDDYIVTSLGNITTPDYVGEIADFLIRFDKASFVLVLGVYREEIVHLSFRSQKSGTDAGDMIKRIVGSQGSAGGHAKNSGGRILLTEGTGKEGNKILKKVIQRSLELIHGNRVVSGIPLLSLGDYLGKH